jgi:hypothetical protein
MRFRLYLRAREQHQEQQTDEQLSFNVHFFDKQCNSYEQNSIRNRSANYRSRISEVYLILSLKYDENNYPRVVCRKNRSNFFIQSLDYHASLTQIMQNNFVSIQFMVT